MGSTSAAAVRTTRESVLDLSSEKKLEYFSRIIARHPKMNSALDDLLTLTAPATGTDIVLLIGPSGVGKSETLATAQKRLLSRFETAMQADPGLIPVVVVEAPASGELQFSWRAFYTKLGEALNEPLLDRKRLTVVEDGRWSQQTCVAGSTVAALRMALEKALKRRAARLLVIDEAAHLLSDPRPAKLLAHMDALKSLANVSGITLALDFPIKPGKSFPLFDRLAQMTLEFGGKLYPAKDARMTAAQYQKSYPEWQQFLRYKDPLLSSSFWERVTREE